ncbi:MAG: dihydropteroate synthase [Desulfacinum sp.]|nr:dihydropteroate synthase [Desulfacinum sp.]
MLIIGEKINSTRKAVDAAVRRRDREFIEDLARRQAAAGAHLLDVNCGTLDAEEEPQAMAWLVEVVQQATGLPLCLDSANPRALAAGLEVHQGRAMINSISGESARYREVLPLLRETDSQVVLLGLDDQGIPPTREKAREVGGRLVDALCEAGIEPDRVYFDPLVRSVATNPQSVVDTLLLMDDLRQAYPGLHFVSGVSNVSFGLPARRHLNRAYVVLSIAHGLDAVIMDPTDTVMGALIYAAEALLARDRFCLEYIKAFQNKKLDV